MWVHARIHIHQGKTQFWNHGGIEPPDCQRIYAAARAFDPNFVVWRGDATLPTEDQGVTILGTPLGHPDFVEASLQAKSREHDTLFDRLVAVPDLQCAWLLLLFCASTRANYMLRVVHPELSHGFAARRGSRVWSTLTRLLGVEGSECARQRASLPFSIGGLGLRSAVRTSTAAYWSSWADTLSMIRARHPTVADDVVIALSANLGGLHLQGANSCRRRLQDAGFDAPEWGDLSRGLRPGQRGLDDAPEPGAPRHGWQRVAAQEADASFFRGVVWPRLTPSEQALSRSQGGPMAGLPFTCCPVALCLPSLGSMPRFSGFSSCGASGAHSLCPVQVAGVAVHSTRVAITVQLVTWLGFLGHRGFSLESAAARICREAGARVSLNVRVQDLDLLPLGSQDNRRIEIIADGLPLFHGAQLAVDTTMVSALRADGNPRHRSDVLDGATLSQARRRKELTYPELTGEHGRARLVVLACEVGGRWSDETCRFIAGLARAKARSEPRAIRAAARRAWHRRWSTLLACCGARAFGLSLLERRPALGVDGTPPSTSDVVGDCRHDGL